jgi:hypothetical protein
MFETHVAWVLNMHFMVRKHAKKAALVVKKNYKKYTINYYSRNYINKEQTTILLEDIKCDGVLSHTSKSYAMCYAYFYYIGFGKLQ